MMKLSEQLKLDFLKDVQDAPWLYKKTKIYKMSYDYLTDLIRKVEELEDDYVRQKQLANRLDLIP